MQFYDFTAQFLTNPPPFRSPHLSQVLQKCNFYFEVNIAKEVYKRGDNYSGPIRGIFQGADVRRGFFITLTCLLIRQLRLSVIDWGPSSFPWHPCLTILFPPQSQKHACAPTHISPTGPAACRLSYKIRLSILQFLEEHQGERRVGEGRTLKLTETQLTSLHIFCS